MSVDLRTHYLGLVLKNPVAASASPLTGHLDTARRLEDAGVSALTLPSLFEEQIEHEALEANWLQEMGAGSFAEADDGYFVDLEDYNTGPDAYLENLRRTKEALDIPVIASLNGISVGGWVKYGKMMEDAGADALELNVYYVAADLDTPGTAVEDRYLELVRAVRAEVSVPLALKMSPYFSSPGHMARRLVDAGANGLILFNRFMQPDIELEDLHVGSSLTLSSSAELLLPLRWIAIMHGRIDASLAATSGAHTAHDVLKLVLAGADVAALASALLRNGPEHVVPMLKEIERWMTEHEYASVEQMKGSLSHENSPEPAAFERSNYMHALRSFSSSFEAPPVENGALRTRG